MGAELWRDGGTTAHAHVVPRYGMRYVAKVLKTTLAERFPDASENEVYKASAVCPPQIPELSFVLLVPVNPWTETKG